MKLKTGLYLVAAIVLLGGLGSAIAIYLNTEDEPVNMSIYAADHSKMRRHNLQLYGGNMAVFEDEFLYWWAGLWEGRSLAYTVGFLALFATGVLCLAAHLVPAATSSTDARQSGA